LLLRFASRRKVSTAQRFLGAALHFDGPAQKLPRAAVLLSVAAIGLDARPSRRAAWSAAVCVLLTLALLSALTGSLPRLLALLAFALALLLTLALLTAGLLPLLPLTLPLALALTLLALLLFLAGLASA
jgi:hypothetical protein